jgi:hypothetical protein
MESYLCLKLLGGAEQRWCGRKLQLFTGLHDEGDDKWSDMVGVIIVNFFSKPARF